MGLLDPPGLTRAVADRRYASGPMRRRGGLANKVLPRQLMTTPPALSITNGNSPVVGGSGTGTPGVGLTSGLITIAGATAVIPNTIGNTSAFRRSDRAPDTNNRKDGPWKLIFGTDAVQVGILVYWDAGQTYRVQVDDQYISFTPSTPGVSGATRWLLIDFTNAGGAKARKIVFETGAAIQGIDVPTAATVWPIPAKGPTALYFGDSYTGGSAGNDASYTTWPSIVADLLGWENTFQNAVGSTGILATVGGYANNLDGQITAAIAANLTPDVVIASPGHNDVAANSDLATALAAGFTKMRTAWPDAILTYIGPFYVGGTASMTATWAPREALLIPAITGIADVIIPQASGAGRPWFTGTGKVGSPTGVGNSDLYVYSDGIHPTQAGHNYIGHRIAHELAARLG